MFFRREKLHQPTFHERIGSLNQFGLHVEALGTGKARVSRNCIAAIVEDVPGERAHVDKAGLTMGGEVGLLVNGGYQMFWETPLGRRAPAQAGQLKELHAFQEDLKEGLGLSSLYNESLGTISDLHLYDRVENRDEGDTHRPWDKR